MSINRRVARTASGGFYRFGARWVDRISENIAAEKARCEAQLARTPHGPIRDALITKIRQLATASHMNERLAAIVTRINCN
jgi:hypothetical protein